MSETTSDAENSVRSLPKAASITIPLGKEEWLDIIETLENSGSSHAHDLAEHLENKLHSIEEARRVRSSGIAERRQKRLARLRAAQHLW